MIRGLIYSIISALAFASMAVLAKMGYAAGMNHWEMLQSRFVFGVAILFLYLLVRHPDQLRASPRVLIKSALIGLTLYGTQSTCFFMALERIPASTAALILYFYPVTVTLMSAVVFRARITRVVGLSLVLVMAGCALVFYDAFLKSLDMTGILFALGAMTVFSIYLVVCQMALKDEAPYRICLYVLFFTMIFFCLQQDPTRLLHFDSYQMTLAVSLGLFPTVIAVTTLYKAIEAIGSSLTSIFSTIEPVATMIMAYYLIGENIVLLQMGGVVLIVVGIIVPNIDLLRRRQRVLEGDFQ